jgi:hypothetical protein
MAKRQVFRGLNVQYFPLSGTSTGVAEQQQAQSFSNLAANIDRTLRFALGKVETESEIAAYEYAASNPLTASEYLNADPIERSKLLPKGTNKYKQVLRNAQVNFMATDISMAASKDISALEQEAVTYDMSADEFENRLNSIVDGYTQSFLDIDAEGAVTVKAKLATMAHTSYNSYLSDSIKKAKDIKAAVVDDYAQTSIDSVAKEVNAYMDTIKIADDINDQEVTLTIDQHLTQKKERVKNELILQGYKNLDQWSKDFDAEVIKQKQNVLTTYYDTPGIEESATQAMAMVEEAENGTFGGNTQLQNIYNSLPENEQEAYLDKIDAWATGVRQQIEDKEKARVLDANGAIKNIRINYHEAKEEGDFTSAKAALDEMKNTDPTAYLELLKDFNTAKDDDNTFTDSATYDNLEVSLLFGDLTFGDVDEAYSKRQITAKQRSYFKLAIDKRTSKAFTDADDILKKSLAYEDTRISIGDSEEKTLAYEQYRKKSLELYDYMRSDIDDGQGGTRKPTANELIAYAKQIVEVKTDETDLQVKINTLNSKVYSNTKEYGGFYVNNEMKNYIMNSDESIETMQDIKSNYFGNSTNLEKYVDLLISIKGIPEGGYIKVDVEGKLFDKKIKRPNGVTNDVLNRYISDVKALIELYKKQGN